MLIKCKIIVICLFFSFSTIINIESKKNLRLKNLLLIRAKNKILAYSVITKIIKKIII